MSAGLANLMDHIRNQYEIPEIDPQESYQLIESSGHEGLTVIDVRGSDEWDAAHIHNSLHIDKGVIEVKIERLIPDRSQPLLLYCGGGTRSLIAAANLKVMGYQNVTSMAGGFRMWEHMDLPIE